MRPKIDQEKADLIRQLYRAGTPGKILAYQFGLNKSTVSMIVNNKIWQGQREDA
jgi:DNA invertase Pin-like site-specific DNA recombinase